MAQNIISKNDVPCIVAQPAADHLLQCEMELLRLRQVLLGLKENDTADQHIVLHSNIHQMHKVCAFSVNCVLFALQLNVFYYFS